MTQSLTSTPPRKCLAFTLSLLSLLPLLPLLLIIFVSTGCSLHLPLAPNLYANSPHNPFDDVPETLRVNQAHILYATDRLPIPTAESGTRYGSGRSHALEIGLCTVEIGQNLAWPDLVRLSRRPGRPNAIPLNVRPANPTARFPASDAIPVQEDQSSLGAPSNGTTSEQAQSKFHEMLRNYPAPNDEKKEVYLYIHGVRSSFDKAASRIAVLWHFLGRRGVPILYSWPACSKCGHLRGYIRDRESGEFTISHLRRFLRALAASPDVKKVHVIAHSRGTDVFTSALRELNLQSPSPQQTRERLKLGNVILAAPDLDWEVVVQRMVAEQVAAIPERITIYTAEDDFALAAAGWLMGGIPWLGHELTPRLGSLSVNKLSSDQLRTLERITNLDVIDVRADTDFLSHTYFTSNPAVLSDLILLLRDNLPANSPQRPLVHRDSRFWELHNGYPSPAPTNRASKPQPAAEPSSSTQ